MATAGWTLWIELLSVVHVLSALLVVYHCLTRRREATSAILWMFVAWSLPILGPLLFIMFGINRVPGKAWKKQRSDDEFLRSRHVREEAACPLAYWREMRKSLAADPESALARELNRSMNATSTDFPLLGGNRIIPLAGGAEAYPRMLEAIRAARHHIHLQTFILAADPTGRLFLDELSNRAREGVVVRLLYDRFGSTAAILSGMLRKYRGIPNLQLMGWTQANPVKRQFQINLRNHRKILIVDGQTAFTGGMNLASININLPGRPADRDYHFAVEGPLVQELQYTFLRDWYFMTDEDCELLLNERHFPPIPPAGTTQARVLNGGPAATELEALTDVIFAALVEARRQILLLTPYLVPTADIVRALRTAALGGLDVRIVVPEVNNHPVAGLAGKALYEDLLSAGVRIFERPPPFMHAKALVVDDEVSIVGTANLDVRSLRLNYETNLAVFDKDFAGRLKRLMLEDMALSRELDLLAWRRRPAHLQIAENFCSLLTPIL